MTVPDCDRCDGANSLEPLGQPDGAGYRWFYCTCCSSTMLVAPDGRIVRHGDEHRRKPTFVGGGAE